MTTGLASLYGKKDTTTPQMSPVSTTKSSFLPATTKPNLALQVAQDSGELVFVDPITGAVSSPSVDGLVNEAGMDRSVAESIVNSTAGGAKGTPWYQDSKMLGSIAGLGSAFAQLAALPSAIDMAKTQSAALKQNIATAKEEQARRNKNISAFNSFNAG